MSPDVQQFAEIASGAAAPSISWKFKGTHPKATQLLLYEARFRKDLPSSTLTVLYGTSPFQVR